MFAPAAAPSDSDRLYEEVVTPPVFTPPAIAPGGGLTTDQAEVLTDLGQTAADLLSLNLALGATAQRLNWAAQAAGVAGATASGSHRSSSPQSQGALHYLDVQYQAYREFANQYAGKLDLFADQIDDLLATVSDADNVYYLAEDFQTTRDELAATGFDAELRSFYEQSGLSDELIDSLEDDVVAAFDGQANVTISFADALMGIEAELARPGGPAAGAIPGGPGRRRNSPGN